VLEEAITLLAALRIVLAIALVAITSGAPRVVMAAIDDGDCCAEPCGGELDGKHCPPNCTQGACAKLLQSLVARPVTLERRDGSVGERCIATEIVPSLPLVVRGVFHPPPA
jgi:hypothetical protein